MYMMLLIHVHTTNGQENTTMAIVPDSVATALAGVFAISVNKI